ncbi:hypothetical protein E2C01_028070 [Portunus trituberculatus]|uniref:Uncharacterized protein n=1 Tax=Portunus trituberculatus TaxID=210409 RepID=A0A5B7EP29_PORTR|nr:hypothetical protein [Portunus trituberculatus]
MSSTRAELCAVLEISYVMALYEEVWNDWEVLDLLHIEEDDEFQNGQGVVRQKCRRIVKDQMKPFTAMDNDEFVDRFRLRKTSMYDLIEEIRDQLPAPHDSRGDYFPHYKSGLMSRSTTPPNPACGTLYGKWRSPAYCK